MSCRKQIRDLLYLDFDKAASLWSQIEGGLRETVSESSESGKGQKAEAKLKIPKLAEANLGVDYLGKRSILETKTLHHDVLNGIEGVLTKSKLVVDLADTFASEVTAEKLRESIGEFPYLRVTGPSVFEDYQRILSISEKFNDIAKFVTQCGLQPIKESEEYRECLRLIKDKKIELNRTKDRNQKAILSKQIKDLELSTRLDNAAPSIEKWLLDGMNLWISTFVQNRINFRIYPVPSCPSFQVLCNLKRDCFVDQDSEHLLYGYGNRPNVNLTVFGLVTSIPPRDPKTLFDPMTEFSDPSVERNENILIEEAMRNLFSAFDNLEGFMRYSRYPNVTIHPIAVYRLFDLE